MRGGSLESILAMVAISRLPCVNFWLGLSSHLARNLLPTSWTNAMFAVWEMSWHLTLRPSCSWSRWILLMPKRRALSQRVTLTFSPWKLRIRVRMRVFLGSCGTLCGSSFISEFCARTVSYLAILIKQPCWFWDVTYPLRILFTLINSRQLGYLKMRFQISPYASAVPNSFLYWREVPSGPRIVYFVGFIIASHAES